MNKFPLSKDINQFNHLELQKMMTGYIFIILRKRNKIRKFWNPQSQEIIRILLKGKTLQSKTAALSNLWKTPNQEHSENLKA